MISFLKLKNFCSNIYFKISMIAIFSRFLAIFISAIPSYFFQSFDKSADIHVNKSIFKYLLSWDAIHFLNIADKGYYYEHSIPFFPMLPLIIRYLPGSNNLTKTVIFNSILTIVSACILYKISIQKYSFKISFISTLVFIFNPATIIYSSFYSEALFTFLFLAAYYHLSKNRMLKAAILLSFASLTRSNTILFVIFFTSLYIPLIILPLALFQLYCLLLIIRLNCHFQIKVPYSYIQVKYWNHGFLNAINLKNTPNLLAGVVFIAYAIYIIYLYAESRIYIYRQAKQNITSSNDIKINKTKTSDSMESKNFIKNDMHNNQSTKYNYTLWNRMLIFINDPFCINYISLTTKLAIILAFQVFTLIFFIHWNIAFRFISYNPLIYWAFAFLATKHYDKLLFRATAIFFFTYGTVYCILFGRFYPPA